MRKLEFRNLVGEYWQPVALYGALVLFFGGLLWFRLGTLVDGYSADELTAMQASTSLRHIFENPINAPFHLLGRGLLYLGDQSLLFMRLAASIIGLITLSMFYWLVRHWHGERAAIFGTIIFGSSAWFLHTARLGTPDVMMFGLLALIACGIWLKRTDNPWVLLLLFVLAASLVYVPGMIWFIGLVILWKGKTIDRIFKRHLPAVTVGTWTILAILAPLGLAIYKSPELAKVVAGLPATGWPQALDALERLGNVPLSLFWRVPPDPQHWLASLPILSAFSVVMLGLGVFVYARHWRLKRTKLLAVLLIIGTALVSLGGAVSLSIIIPFVYILIAVGVGFMLDRWYRVFPRNTIAQGVGMGLISLAVIANCWFQWRRYFVAWPAAPATKPIFIIKE